MSKIAEIWSDLDLSYNKYSHELNVSDKLEFLKKICNFKDGKNQIPFLISILCQEDVDAELKTQVISKLNAVDTIFKATDRFKQVLDTSIERTLGSIIARDEMDNQYVRVFTEDVLGRINLKKVEVKTLTADRMFDKFGVFGSVYLKGQSYKLDTNIDTGVFTILNVDQIKPVATKIVGAIKSGNFEEWIKTTNDTLKDSIANQRLTFPSLIVNSKHFSVKDGKVTVKLAKKKFTTTNAELVELEDGHKYLYFDKSMGSKSSIRVFCILDK